MNVDLSNTFWEKIVGYPTECRVDVRWLLRKEDSEKTYGSLRIVSHPDLPPGHLRAFFIYITDLRKKDEHEIMKTIEDYQIDITELEVYSIDQEVKTETEIIEAPFGELENLFNVKIFK